MEKIYEIIKIKQVRVESNIDLAKVKSPDDAAAEATKIASSLIGDEDREVFLVMCLNTQLQVIAVHRAHVGTLDASLVHPREVFKAAILNNSQAIIVAHQHPSSKVNPSREDIKVTERLVKAGAIMGINVLDSLVVSDDPNNFTSLKDKGYI